MSARTAASGGPDRDSDHSASSAAERRRETSSAGRAERGAVAPSASSVRGGVRSQAARPMGVEIATPAENAW
ncbi:hypothetical protein ACGH7X_40795 [Streptomyces sp. BBFR51]|uniref:hypothetical protein n=1 Tax=Streptomyces sp. BBFR51 TaxID=3372856 RepID=UPI0037DD969D